ncbi:methylamine utilization protein MauJ [Roseateles paludis]|uniref:Methylamine utilization protein MauJ n=1 Tax=Roseateles paludis TaxID=3145238 RepID=A0ABV0FYW8_9BURK
MNVPSVLHICFDNSHRLTKRVHLFRYKQHDFKLVQSTNRQWADHLLTIVNTEAELDEAFRIAAEFVSALAWETGGRSAVWIAGSTSRRSTLRAAKPSIFTFTRVNPFDRCVGFGLSSLPDVVTHEQRIALALFREARAANSPYQRFLFMWQVLEVLPGSKGADYVDRTLALHRPRLRDIESPLSSLDLSGKSLGNHLWDDCRSAIAHIRRDPARGATIEFDSSQDQLRIDKAGRVIEVFARDYIEHELGLTQCVYLKKPAQGGIAEFKSYPGA